MYTVCAYSDRASPLFVLLNVSEAKIFTNLKTQVQIGSRNSKSMSWNSNESFSGFNHFS
jgi:hypothetical protein